jgi:hypothetical protein
VPPSNSSARVFFDRLNSLPDPFSELSSIPDPNAAHYPFFEEEWLDFKGNPRSDKDAKKIWSKALSGYANITDGLIIWGIDARKMRPRNIDAASKLSLIPDPHAFESKLREWIRDATNPPVMKVEYLTREGQHNEGFVVCLIPESSHKPHRAEWSDHQYYYRASDDFLPAQPGLLRTLFYPQSNPQLRVKVELTYHLQPTDAAQSYANDPKPERRVHLLNTPARVDVEATLQNTGTATAQNVFAVVRTHPDIADLGGGSDWSERQTPLGKKGFLGARSLHPGDASHFMHWSPPSGVRTKEIGNHQIIPCIDEISMTFLLYADNATPQRASVAFSDEDAIHSESGKIVKLATEEPWQDPFEEAVPGSQ